MREAVLGYGDVFIKSVKDNEAHPGALGFSGCPQWSCSWCSAQSFLVPCLTERR